jgi:hypothetical protein
LPEMISCKLPQSGLHTWPVCSHMLTCILFMVTKNKDSRHSKFKSEFFHCLAVMALVPSLWTSLLPSLACKLIELLHRIIADEMT